ncbi:hypothetical protein [Lentzea sp. NPDC055074]
MRLLDETSSGVAETGYCYDAAERLLSTVGASVVSDVRYDNNGNTTQCTTSGATTHLSWDGADRNIAARVTGADAADVSYSISLPGGVIYTWKSTTFTLDHPSDRAR